MTAEVCRAAKGLQDDALSACHLKVRLVGVGVSNFAGNPLTQMTLFDDDPVEQEHARQRKLDAVADTIRDKFGVSALGKGNTHLQSRP